jgi:hypothetical protein
MTALRKKAEPVGDDKIRIKTGVSMRAIHNSKQEDTVEVDRAEWEAMTPEGREKYLDDLAQGTIANEVEAWAYVDEEG